MIKEQCNAKLENNRLLIEGTNINHWYDILSDGLLLLPYKTDRGYISLGVYLQTKIIYARYKDDLFKHEELYISGHSLGAGIGLQIALFLYLDGYIGKIHLSGKGGVKCISHMIAFYLFPRIKTIEWSVNYRDPIPYLGWWDEPIHNTPRTGKKRKHILDWDIKEHVNYWGNK